MSPEHDAAPGLAPQPARWSRAGSLVCILLLTWIVWMSQAVPPFGVAVEGPDGSYQTGFEYFFRHGLRAGVDWVYTYGPLGLLQNATYDPETFTGRLLFGEGIWRGACALAVTLAFLNDKRTFWRVFAFMAIVFLPLVPDGYLYLHTLAAVELCFGRPRNPWVLLLAIVVLVPASLAKFVSFGLWVPSLIATVMMLWVTVSRRWALGFLAASATLWLALWTIVCDQSLLDIPAFLVRSFEMSSAYSSAMATECAPDIEPRGIRTFFALTATLLLALVFAPRTKPRFAQGLFRVFVLIASFKAGFVRGADHPYLFFWFAALAPFVLVDPPLEKLLPRILEIVLRLVTFAAAFFGLHGAGYIENPPLMTLGTRAGMRLGYCLDFLADPRGQRAELDRRLAQAKEVRGLPRTKERVGRETIDILPPFQDTVVFNDFEWRPRPVFQSYATLSRRLQEVNARFFESERAPQWLLHQPSAIDGRLQTMEDAPALLAIVRDYQPVHEEAGLLLLRRVPGRRDAEPDRVLIDRELAFEERLDLSDLPAGLNLLRLDVAPTWRGRLRAALLRPVPLHARITASDGRTSRVQLIPGMLQTGAILDPYLNDLQDWIRLWAGRAARATTLTLETPLQPDAYPDRVRVRILASSIRPAHVDIESDWATRFAMFATSPDRIMPAGTGVPAVESGEPVLAVAAPSRIHFRVGAGRRKVSGALGVLSETSTEGACAGLRFSAHHVHDGDHFEKLFELELRPRTRAADRGIHSFEFEFQADTKGEVVLVTRPALEATDKECTGFWTRVRVD